MSVEVCPDRDLLSSHLLGKVWGAQAETIDRHVAACSSCLNVARQISVEDEFTQILRKGKPEIEGSESEVAVLIERGKQILAEAETFQSQDTLRPGASDEGDAPCEDLSFLAPPERPDEIGRLGGYRVLEVLGVGGMGIVFRAEDPRLERLVALKAMRPAVAASRSAKDRFLREAKATAAIDHDNIVTIHQVGEDRDVPFIAMQFLRGESLQTRLQREKRLDQREALRIGREVAAGLTAAHQRGLIHRDIKPDNIWLEEGVQRAKVLDFGLVRPVSGDAGLTQTGTVLGTPRYMAPEQALGQAIDHRCDLFSLGSVLYHLTTGKPPFQGSGVTATLIAVAHNDPEPVESLCPNLDPELSRLIMRLLSKDLDQRPHTADEVRQAIAEIERRLDATPTYKDSPSPDSGAQPVSRRRFVLGAAVALLVAVASTFWAAEAFRKPTAQRGPPAAPTDRESAIRAPAASAKVSAVESVANASPADRQAAQWVLDIGGEVAIKTNTASELFFTAPDALPEEPFSLTWIKLSGNRKVTDDGLKRLTGLKSLSVLNLNETPIGDAGAAHLTDLPELSSLNLVATQVTERGLAPLAAHPRLTRLYVSRCPIHDPAIAVLREMNLEQLTIDGTEVTFEGLQQLAGNSALRSLTVTHLELTADEARQLSDLLPNCLIRSDHGPFGPKSLKP
jgi:serine/threonine protein kinase